MAEVIVIDLGSVIPEISRQGRNMTGNPVSGLVNYVKAEQAKGSTIFFISGAAHDPFMRQSYERLLEGVGITRCFITHGLPTDYDSFISNKAFFFNGIDFPPL